MILQGPAQHHKKLRSYHVLGKDIQDAVGTAEHTCGNVVRFPSLQD